MKNSPNQPGHNERPRLVQCFSAVFPSLTAEQIAAAEQAQLPEWDSIMTVTLIALIEDEFHVEIPTGEIQNLTSFDGFSRVLASAGVHSAAQ